MTLDELLKQATPLPWGLNIGEQCCFHQGNRVSIMRQVEEGPDDDDCGTIAEVWPTDEDLDIADGRLIVHAVNMLPKLVAAVEQYREAKNRDDGDAWLYWESVLTALFESQRPTTNNQQPTTNT